MASISAMRARSCHPPTAVLTAGSTASTLADFHPVIDRPGDGIRPGDQRRHRVGRLDDDDNGHGRRHQRQRDPGHVKPHPNRIQDLREPDRIQSTTTARDTRSSTRRSRRHAAVRSAIFMHTACPVLRALFSKVDTLAVPMTPFLPAPLNLPTQV
jgi:hypothetical protein